MPIVAIFSGLLFWVISGSAVADSICAEVKIEIAQELTVERQAFEATMRISNSLDSFRLEDIKVTLTFQDENGDPVVATSDPNHSSAAFFVWLDDYRGMQSVGTGEAGAITDGVIDPSETGELRWLIIPTPGSGGDGPNGKLYFVGAQLDLRYGNERETLVAAPDTIRVKPQPSLILDYFLPREVHGDNPMTPEIEPVEPYTLGVRVANTGSGSAYNLRIESAQPEIVENEQNLLVDFTITGSYIDNQAAERSLLLNFGTIPGKANRTGRWIMESSLSGRFTEFNARFTHADELGGALTSLIDNVNAHRLLSDVVVDLPGRDRVRDYLAEVGEQLLVFESDHTGLNRMECVDCSEVHRRDGSLGPGQGSPNGTLHTMTVASATGFTYIQAVDPYQGQRRLDRAVRDDGSLLHGANVWQSKSLRDDKVSYDYYINLFDVRPATRYNLTFGSEPRVNRSPELAFIPDYTTHETGQVGFLVLASDPDGTVPNLSAQGLPSGATFTDRRNGQGVFNWRPEVGQAGTYTVTFEASDGVLSSQRTSVITVNPEDDPDGSGGDGGDGGDGDPGDGSGDGDPGDQPGETAPPAPQIVSPIFGGEISDLSLALRIRSTAGSETPAALTYTVEIYRDASFSDRLGRIEQVYAMGEYTDIELRPAYLDGHSLQAGEVYYWRIKAELGDDSSEWVNSQFTVLGLNQPPLPFTLSAPAQGAAVDSLTPRLVVNNAQDPEGHDIVYGFEVYDEADTAFQNPVAQVYGIPQGAEGTTAWTVAPDLNDGQYYLWLAYAEDELGATTVSNAGSFRVQVQNEAPSLPDIVAPMPGTLVTTRTPSLIARGSVDPEGFGVTYRFSLRKAGAEEVLQQDISPAGQQAVWVLPELEDNQGYHWWVSATDGVTESESVSGYFEVVTGAIAPAVPSPANPAPGAVIEVASPMLSVHPVAFPELVTVSYEFELYRASAPAEPLTTQVTEAPEWPLSFALDSGREYLWRVRAVAANDTRSDWTAMQGFRVDLGTVNVPPQFDFVLPDQDLTVTGGEILIQWVDHDPDSNALITLFYNGDQVIAAGIEEDPDGSGDQYRWNIDHLPPGEYRLSAMIEDEGSQEFAESCCVIRKQTEEAKVQVSPLEGLYTDEWGLITAEVQVSLTAPPAEGKPVVIQLAVSNPDLAELTGLKYLEFNHGNWSEPQTVTVRGRDDCRAAGNQNYFLQFSPSASLDDAFNGLRVPSVAVVSRDKATPGQTEFVCRYDTVRKELLPGGVVEHEIRPKMINRGLGISHAIAKVSVQQPGVTLMSADTVSFTGVGEGSLVSAQETLTLRYGSEVPFVPQSLAWSVSSQRPALDVLPYASAAVGEEYSFSLLPAGSPADDYSFSLLSGPEGMYIDAQGVLRWTPDASQAGYHRVVADIIDKHGGVARAEFLLDVAPDVGGLSRVVVVDTNSAGNAHYRSLQEAVNGEAGTLNQPLTIVARATSGVADRTPVNARQVVTSEQNTLTLVFEPGYRLDVAMEQSGAAISLATDHVRIIGNGNSLTVRNRGHDHVSAIRLQGGASVGTQIIDGLSIIGVAEGSAGNFTGIRADMSGGSLVLRNNVFRGFVGSGEFNMGIQSWRRTYAYNNTLTGNGMGLWLTTSQATLYNNIAVDNELLDYLLIVMGSITSGRNLSGDFSSPDPEWRRRESPFANPVEGDFRLKPTASDALGKGMNLSRTGQFPFEGYANGAPRGSDWHLGALPVSNDANHPPRFTSEPVVSVPESGLYRYQPEATDQDGDVLTFHLERGPQGMTINPETGELVWQTGNGQEGTHDVIIEVMDARGGIGRQQFTLVVTMPDFVGRIAVVDTNPDADADYHSLQEAILAEQGVLTEPLVIRLRASTGVADTNPAVIEGIQTSEAAPLTVVFERGYTLSVSARSLNARALEVRASHVALQGEGGLIRIRSNGLNGMIGVFSNPLADNAVHLFDSLRVEGIDPGYSLTSRGIRVGRSSGRYIIRNNLVHGFEGLFSNIGIEYQGEAYVYNNTVVGNRVGFGHGSANSHVYNNIATNNRSADYYPMNRTPWPETQGHNLSGDGSSPSAEFRDLSVLFKATTLNDYRLSPEDSVAIGYGLDLSYGVPYEFNRDGSGALRTGLWNLGALPVAE